MYSRKQIESIATTDKSVVVNKINQKYELVFKKQGRLFCTVYLPAYRYPLIEQILKHFLATGDVPHELRGVWVV